MGDNPVAEEEVRAAFARHEHLTPAVEPMRKVIHEATVRRRRRRRLARVSGVVMIVLALLLPGGYGLRLAGVIGPPRVEGLHTGGAAPGAPDRPLTVLLVGVDGKPSGQPRADMVLIAHVPADRSAVYLLSIPRDLMVDIPTGGRADHEGGTAKVAEVFHYGERARGADEPALAGGNRLLSEALTGVTGLRFDAVASLDFPALRGVTDAVGGVRMCLDHEVRSVHTGRRYPAGCQRLGGDTAIDVLRQRYGLPGGALERDRNGREYIRGLVAAVRSGGVLTEVRMLDKVLRSAGSGLRVDSAGYSVVDLAIAGRDIAATDVVGLSLPLTGFVEDGKAMLRFTDNEQAKSLFRAYADDRVADWLREHPGRTD